MGRPRRRWRRGGCVLTFVCVLVITEYSGVAVLCVCVCWRPSSGNARRWPSLHPLFYHLIYPSVEGVTGASNPRPSLIYSYAPLSPSYGAWGFLAWQHPLWSSERLVGHLRGVYGCYMGLVVWFNGKIAPPFGVHAGSTPAATSECSPEWSLSRPVVLL